MKTQIEKLQERTSIDYDRIAEGFYNMIPESEKRCMRLGMLPAKFMELLETAMISKFESIVKPVRDFYDDAFEGIDDFLKDSQKECDCFVKDNVTKAIREISIRLISIATEKGLCIV